MTNQSMFAKYTDAQTFAKIVDFANITEMWAVKIFKGQSIDKAEIGSV